jgi:hypothetical protein
LNREPVAKVINRAVADLLARGAQASAIGGLASIFGSFSDRVGNSIKKITNLQYSIFYILCVYSLKMKMNQSFFAHTLFTSNEMQKKGAPERAF